MPVFELKSWTGVMGKDTKPTKASDTANVGSVQVQGEGKKGYSLISVPLLTLEDPEMTGLGLA